MRPRASWIILTLTVLVIQNVFSRKINPARKKGVTAEPGKKTIIGSIDLKKLSSAVKPEDCRDVGKDCATVEDSCLLNFYYMFEKCKLTCRFCTKGVKPKKCKNLHPECSKWSRAGDCLHYVAFMKDNCKRSCQLCEPGQHYTDKDERCPIWGKRGICRLNANKMLQLCPYSCNKYRRRYIVYTTPYHTPPQHNIHAPVHHTTHTSEPYVAPTPPPTEEQLEDNEEARKEWEEEVKNREKEKEFQEWEKNDAAMGKGKEKSNHMVIVVSESKRHLKKEKKN